MNNEIRDIKPPVDIPDFWIWLWVILGAIALMGLIWLALRYFKRLQKQQEQVMVPLLPAWQRAYDRLEDLRLSKLMEQPDLKLFYSELSGIIRQYLEEQFSIRAPEMTTEEFLDYLRRSATLNDEQKQTLKEFLSMSDMVKFARHQPSVFEAQKSFDLVKQLIDQTHGI